jgi:hypothetical protein
MGEEIGLGMTHSLCHCEAKQVSRSNLGGQVCVARNDNITVPPPLWAEVRGKAQFRSQLPTLHCL